MMRKNYTAIVERDRDFESEFFSEPYECGWASEAIFFVRKLSMEGDFSGSAISVQISPDGIQWCDEGTTVPLTNGTVDFVRVKHFGNWLRVKGVLSSGAKMRTLIALQLKE
jgi:hypothetical protein